MHIKAHRSAGGAKGGALAQAIGRSPGGRTTKVHALTDEQGRPLALILTPGHAHDLTGARDLLAITGAPAALLADRAYDATSLRSWLTEHGCQPVIPPRPYAQEPSRLRPCRLQTTERYRTVLLSPQRFPQNPHSLR